MAQGCGEMEKNGHGDESRSEETNTPCQLVTLRTSEPGVQHAFGRALKRQDPSVVLGHWVLI